jgi:hypothetical protein
MGHPPWFQRHGSTLSPHSPSAPRRPLQDIGARRRDRAEAAAATPPHASARTAACVIRAAAAGSSSFKLQAASSPPPTTMAGTTADCPAHGPTHGEYRTGRDGVRHRHRPTPAAIVSTPPQRRCEADRAAMAAAAARRSVTHVSVVPFLRRARGADHRRRPHWNAGARGRPPRWSPRGHCRSLARGRPAVSATLQMGTDHSSGPLASSGPRDGARSKRPLKFMLVNRQCCIRTASCKSRCAGQRATQLQCPRHRRRRRRTGQYFAPRAVRSPHRSAADGAQSPCRRSHLTQRLCSGRPALASGHNRAPPPEPQRTHVD